MLWGAAPGAGAAALKLCLNMMLSCFLCDGSLKTYPGHVANMSAISWTFVFVFLKFIPQKKKKAISSPFSHQPSSKSGAKALVQLNWFLCCSIPQDLDKGSLSCSYYTQYVQAVPMSVLDEPSPTTQIREQQHLRLKMAQTNLSVSGTWLYLQLSSPEASQRTGALLKCTLPPNPAMLR